MRLRAHSPVAKVLAAVGIAGVAATLALGFRVVPGLSIAMHAADLTLYDSVYKLRGIEDQNGGDIVIVAVDHKSLEAIKKAPQWKYGWPWPREMLGAAAQYIDGCGPRAIVFDLLYSEQSAHNDTGDDDSFAKRLNTVKAPMVFAMMAPPEGTFDDFAIQLERKPILGAANTSHDKIMRVYDAGVMGWPSEAKATVRAVGMDSSQGLFYLHYYGPSVNAAGKRTFRYLSAVNVIQSGLDPKTAAANGITPDMFRGKIVLIGAIDAGTYDVKSTPLSAECPGVEVQATAIENLLHGQFVQRVGRAGLASATLLAALLAALGVVLPRKAWVKLIGAGMVIGALLAAAIAMFVGREIHWLPLASPLLAAMLATVIAFTWSYLTEDRQRRFALRALSQYISPAVTADIANDPGKLKLGGERREMTVIFTDIAGFTDLSETLDVHKLSELLNYYLDEMSEMILATDGTLDKYVGDAIIGFWNAPVDQPDHAIRACRAALSLRRREAEIQGELRKRGAAAMHTRIGINTGPMAVGNMGSKRKFNYSVLGDAVNFASRLEGANKFYGTRILIAESTADLVREKFLLRAVDVLRVKGKQQPMAVFEVLAEKPAEAGLVELAARYEKALGHYRRMEWDVTETILLEIERRFADDGPTAVLLKRIAHYRVEPPASDWDGVYVAKEK